MLWIIHFIVIFKEVKHIIVPFICTFWTGIRLAVRWQNCEYKTHFQNVEFHPHAATQQSALILVWTENWNENLNENFFHLKNISQYVHIISQNKIFLPQSILVYILKGRNDLQLHLLETKLLALNTIETL